MQTACQRSVYKYADKIPTYLDLFPPKPSALAIGSPNVLLPFTQLIVFHHLHYFGIAQYNAQCNK